MPHSFPIDPASSNRAQRRKAQESSSRDTIQVKANIGAMRGTVRTASQGFDPDAYDGDGDLRVQDGTAFERPAIPRMPDLRGGLQSYTGASRNDYSRLTNGERAEKAVPDSPMQFLADLKRMAEETLGETIDMQDLKQVIDEAGLTFDFSPETVSKMRDAVRAALDNNPKFADTVSRLGLPPIVAVDKGLPFLVSGGFADPAPFIGLKMSHLEQGRVYRALRKMSDKLPFISAEGVTKRLVSDDPDSLIVHEAGHWFAYSASMLGTTDEQREIASLFYTQSWSEWNKLYPTLKNRRAKSLSRLGRAIQEAVDEEGPLPIDAPFVNSEYGMASPVETFAEGVTAMLSADENLMELIDTNLADIIKTVIGDTPTGGTTGLRSQTYQRTRSYDIDEIVDAVVPDNTTDLRRLFKEYGDLFSGGFIDDERIDDEQLDFSPKTISNLRETVRDALEGNPIFAEVVSRYGMPPIFALKDSVYNYAARAHLTYGGAIEFAPETHKRKFGFLTNLAQRGFYSEGNAHYKGTQSLTASDRATVLMHEYGHYLHNLASVSSPNRRVREMLDWFHSEEWSDLDRDEIPPSFRKLARAMTEVNMRDYDYTLERQDDLPFINSKYGMSSPSEFIAEAFALAVGKKTAGKRKHLSSHTEDLVDAMLGDKDISNVHAFDEPASFLDEDPFTGQVIQRGLRSATVPALGRSGTDNNRQMMTPVRPTKMDWLKDFSHEEIAEIVVPTSAHDAVILMAQLRLGPDFDITKRKTFEEIRKIEGKLLGEGDRCLDFSPEGREAMKQELVRALDSSPTFSEFVKMFGLPPILFVSDEEYQKKKGDKSKLFSQLQKKNRPIAWVEPGYFMTFNGSDRSWQADAPTGSFPPMGEDRWGKPIVHNIGIDRVSVIHHEYAHFLWVVLTQNRGTERLKTLGWTQDQVDKIQDTLKTMFDVRYGSVIPQTMRRVDYQVVSTPGGGMALEEIPNPFYDYWNYITWAENNGMPSVLSRYGHTNPQETWAESFASFVSSEPVTSGFINDNFVKLMKDIFSLEEDESEDETMEASSFRLPNLGGTDSADTTDIDTTDTDTPDTDIPDAGDDIPEPPANLTARQLRPSAKRMEGLRSSTERSVPANAEPEQIRQLLQDADEKTDRMIRELTSSNGAMWDMQTRKDEPYSDLIDADKAKKAEDSVRIYVSSDGKPIVRAEPHPIIRRIFGDVMDGNNAYEIPEEEILLDITYRYTQLLAEVSEVDTEDFYNVTLPDGTKIARFKITGSTKVIDEDTLQKEFNIPNIELEILDDEFSYLTPEQFGFHMARNGINDGYRQFTGMAYKKYENWVKDKIKKAFGSDFQKEAANLNRDNFNLPMALGYIAGLRDPLQVLPYFRNMASPLAFHDVFGHYGAGNGFDRHGEFGNMLTMLRIVDLAVAEGALEPHEADYIKHETINLETNRMAAGRFDGEFNQELLDRLRPVAVPPARAETFGVGYENQTSKFYVGNLTEDFQRPLTEAAREQGAKGLRSSTQRFNPKAERFAETVRVESRETAMRLYSRGLRSSTQRSVPATANPDEIRALLQYADSRINAVIKGIVADKGKEWDELSQKDKPFSDLIDKDEAQKAENSVRIYLSSDGVPIVRADPHPILKKIFGDFLEGQNSYEIPNRGTLRKILQNYNNLMATISPEGNDGFHNVTLPDGKVIAKFKVVGGTPIDTSYERQINLPTIELEVLDEKFSYLTAEHFALHMADTGSNDPTKSLDREYLIKLNNWLVNKVKTTLGGEYMQREGDQPALVRRLGFKPMALAYLAGLRDPSQVLPEIEKNVSTVFGMHDPIGHFGAGNGFDRHGEFGNMLVALQVIDLAVKEGVLTPAQAQLVKKYAFVLERSRLSRGRFSEADSVPSRESSEIFALLEPITVPPVRVEGLDTDARNAKNSESRIYVGDYVGDFQASLIEAGRKQGSIGLRSSTQRFTPQAEQFADAIRVESRDLALKQMVSDIDERISRGGLGSSTRKPNARTPKTKGAKAHDSRFKEKYGSDARYGDGDCYSSAVLTAAALSRSGVQNVRVVHGVPLGTGGEAEGIRYPHAWVEATINGEEMVIDNSNGGNWVLPKELYYLFGNIEEDVTRRYSYKEAQNQMDENGHYGPWE